MSLNDRQQAFVQEYLIDLNATQAAIRAGYSKKTAGAVGFENLTKPEIQNAISELKAERSRRLEVNADAILLENLRIAQSDLRKVFRDGKLLHPHEWPDDIAPAISSVKVVTRNLGEGEVEYVAEVKLWDKGAAIDRAHKHLGLYERDNQQKPAQNVSVYHLPGNGRDDAAD